MAEPARKLELSLYESDFHAWTQDQAARLRERASQVDWENVAEEIESLGRSDRRAIRSNLDVVVEHLLKWEYQPEGRKGGWAGSIREHRRRIALDLADSPSLRSLPGEAYASAWTYARQKAADDTGLPLSTFPETPTHSIEQVLDMEFLPGSPSRSNEPHG